MSQETPESITQWAEQTFGATPVMNVATRMNVEVAELLNAIAAGSPSIHVLEECADVYIMLAQVFHMTAPEQNLQEWVNNKMLINRTRRWGVTKNGKAQHL